MPGAGAHATWGARVGAPSIAAELFSRHSCPSSHLPCPTPCSTLIVTEECLLHPSRNPHYGKAGIEAVLKVGREGGSSGCLPTAWAHLCPAIAACVSGVGILTTGRISLHSWTPDQSPTPSPQPYTCLPAHRSTWAWRRSSGCGRAWRATTRWSTVRGRAAAGREGRGFGCRLLAAPAAGTLAPARQPSSLAHALAPSKPLLPT